MVSGERLWTGIYIVVYYLGRIMSLIGLPHWWQRGQEIGFEASFKRKLHRLLVRITNGEARMLLHVVYRAVVATHGHLNFWPLHTIRHIPVAPYIVSCRTWRFKSSGAGPKPGILGWHMLVVLVMMIERRMKRNAEMLASSVWHVSAIVPWLLYCSAEVDMFVLERSLPSVRGALRKTERILEVM